MPSQQEYVLQLRKSLVARQLQTLSQDREPSEWEIRQIQESVDSLTDDQVRNRFSREPFLDRKYEAPQSRSMCGPAS